MSLLQYKMFKFVFKYIGVWIFSFPAVDEFGGAQQKNEKREKAL